MSHVGGDHGRGQGWLGVGKTSTGDKARKTRRWRLAALAHNAKQ
jgi:hypothetical protein